MSNAETEAALDTGVKNRRPSLIAYQVREGKDDQSYWDRIGVAWSNRDVAPDLSTIVIDTIRTGEERLGRRELPN